MFERFTERARQVVVLAQDEARALRHDYIGTEHVLLGLLREEEGLAGRTLRDAGITLAGVRTGIDPGVGEAKATGQIAFTPYAKRALEQSLRTAIRWNHASIGTEHLLAGLLRDPSSRAVRLLADAGLQPAAIAERLFTAIGFTDPVAEASTYAPARDETDEGKH